MLSHTDLKNGVLIIVDGQPYEVLEANFIKKAQRRPTVKTKIKNLITGNTVTESAHPSDSYEDAEVERLNAIFIYERGGEYWFHETKDKSRRFSLSADVLGDQKGFLKTNTEVLAQTFNGNVISVELPPKIDVKVTEAPPSIRGNTSQGGNKVVTIETGAKVATPLFIEAGDIIRVNTQTGEYVERIEKA